MAKYHEFYVTIIVHHKYRLRKNDHLSNQDAPDAQPEVKPEVKKFSALAEEWKKCVGVTLEGSSLKHYSDALRAYILPTFGNKDIRSINREAVELFLASQAAKHSRSSLRSMRVTLCMILRWAEKNDEFQQQPQPHGWLEGIRLPKKVGGRKVTRTELTPEQTRAFVSRMKDPYSTLVLLLASVGVRGEAAVGLQPGDLDAENVLRAKRVIYDGEVIPLTEEEQKKHIFPLVGCRRSC